MQQVGYYGPDTTGRERRGGNGGGDVRGEVDERRGCADDALPRRIPLLLSDRGAVARSYRAEVRGLPTAASQQQ